MKVYESRVRKCKDVSIIIDKKLTEGRMEYEKYIIPLSEKIPLKQIVKILTDIIPRLKSCGSVV